MMIPLRCPMKLACGTMMDVMTKAPKGAKLMGNWISPKMLKLLMPPAMVNGGFEITFEPRHDPYLLTAWQVEWALIEAPGSEGGGGGRGQHDWTHHAQMWGTKMLKFALVSKYVVHAGV